jgi:hypothetical protein
LQCADKLKILHEFFPDVDRLTTIAEDARGKVKNEIDRLFEDRQNHLDDFPLQEGDFKRIYTFLVHLKCIKKVVDDNFPFFSRAAMDAQERATKLLSGSLKTTVDTWDNTKIDDVIQALMRLKKASCVILCWSPDIDRCIDQCLDKSIQNAQNTRGVLLALSSRLQSFETDQHITQQLLTHACFDCISYSLFNEATQGQDIDYILSGLEPASSESGKLRSMYTSFEAIYTTLMEEGLNSEFRGQSFLPELKQKTMELSKDFQSSYSDQVAGLSTHIFAYWLLLSITDFVKSLDSQSSAKKYVRKPYPSQAVAVWLMLNSVSAENMILENQFVKVKTGKGAKGS